MLHFIVSKSSKDMLRWCCPTPHVLATRSVVAAFSYKLAIALTLPLQSGTTPCAICFFLGIMDRGSSSLLITCISSPILPRFLLVSCFAPSPYLHPPVLPFNHHHRTPTRSASRAELRSSTTFRPPRRLRASFARPWAPAPCSRCSWTPWAASS